MAFQYTSLSGIRLNSEEEQLLEKIDLYQGQLKGYVNLADLHSTISVELSDKHNKRPFSYVVTEKERRDIIKRLIQEIWELYRKLFQKINKELNRSVESIVPIVIEGDLRRKREELSSDDIRRRIQKIQNLSPFIGKIEEIKRKIRELESLGNEIRPSEQPNNDDYYNIDLELSRLKDMDGLLDHVRKRIDEIMREIEELGREVNQRCEENWYPENKLSRRIFPIIDELLKEIKRLLSLLFIYFNASKGPNGDYRIGGDYEILGEYVPLQKKVILYYETIKKHEPFDLKRREKLLATVYVHEMMHAYLDYGYVKAYFDKIEEPIAEYAMLSFFDDFNKSILQYAEKHAEAKQKALGIAHYGFGYCLFNNSKRVDWLEDYYNAKPQLVLNGPNIDNYLDFWRVGGYPFDMEQLCMVMLYLSLHCSFDIVGAIQLIMPTKTLNKNGLKIGQYAKQTLTDLLQSNKLTPADISNLEDPVFCKNTLDMNYPVLVDVYNNVPEKGRYYKPDSYIAPYVICNDWYEKNRSKFEIWLATI